MKSSLFLWLGLLSPLAAIPANTTLTLVNQPGYNQITVTVSPVVPLGNLSSSAVTTLTGTVQAFFDINPATGQTSELTLVNGRATGTDMSFVRNAFLGGYNITVSNLSAAINTITPPGVVTPATGSFAANQHRFDIDQGTITGTTSGLLAGDPINESFTPANPASGTGTGNGSVVLVHTGDSGIYRNYTVTATMPVAINDSFVSGSNTVNVTGSGTVRASGTVQVPKTEYLAWTLAQGIPNAPFAGDPDGDGVVNGLLWALGLNANDNPLPHLPRPDPAVAGGFIVPLPPNGLAAPVLIQSSNNLGTWNPAGALTPAFNPIPAGTSGPVFIAPDASPRRFIRLQVTEPQ